MIISPPFLPASGLTSANASKPDPMMDAVDQFELAHGVDPVAFDPRWHCGAHLASDTHGPVYAIADGEVVAYRVCPHAMDSGNGNAGFVLLKHATETGDGRTITFYSLYMHLLPLTEYHTFGFDGRGLPEFLHKPTGQVPQGAVEPAVGGGGNKVRRKDILGYIGRYESAWYLHFEIFMLPGDFDAYFRHTQLDNAAPDTPTTSDCWGHTYYMIPAGQQFFALPPGTDAHNMLHGIKFEPGLTGTNTFALVVETYFSKGAKYTNVWSVAEDGSRALLTDYPVPEADYEYDLSRRATALYAACPSDCYEMLCFGRILSPGATLSGRACATWVQVIYDAGKVGYIDISKPTIKKLSDADFPAFMGRQKLSEGTTPFSSDGLCDIDALKKLVKDAADNAQPSVTAATTEAQRADALSGYGVSGRELWVTLAGQLWAGTYRDSQDDDGDRPQFDRHVTLRALANNGRLPRLALTEATITGTVSGFTGIASVRNVTAPSLPQYPPRYFPGYDWRVLGHFTANGQTEFNRMLVEGARVLRDVLELYDWTADDAIPQRIGAIRTVRFCQDHVLIRGLAVRVVRIHVDLDAGGFDGPGDAVLFGDALNHFLGRYANPQHSTQMVLTIDGQETVYPRTDFTGAPF
ncbi:type VI secretion system baseplate subunit TssF [Paraburkholderia sacchari]|uniref:type VI secretion system baseplate subunit TssF n=1 Tax=Paraburkholderia sacchari TaxID=159450 RepID=UPI001FD0836E|nr:type VI secretion system baseplate subunit TssF [Paraburkholderia sacchari]